MKQIAIVVKSQSLWRVSLVIFEFVNYIFLLLIVCVCVCACCFASLCRPFIFCGCLSDQWKKCILHLETICYGNSTYRNDELPSDVKLNWLNLSHVSQFHIFTISQFANKNYCTKIKLISLHWIRPCSLNSFECCELTVVNWRLDYYQREITMPISFSNEVQWSFGWLLHKIQINEFSVLTVKEMCVQFFLSFHRQHAKQSQQPRQKWRRLRKWKKRIKWEIKMKLNKVHQILLKWFI